VAGISPSLGSFGRSAFTHDGKERDVFRKGSGPAVIVMAEMPGITPKVLELADRVVAIGCTAVLPHLFGEPGREGMIGTPRGHALRYGLSSLVPACVSREFTVLASGKSSPVVDWLRALAAAEHERCGGRGVGVIGMCFTGGFALAMTTERSVLVPVLSQPSLPFPISKKARRSVDCSDEDLSVVRARCQQEGLEVLGLRFTGDLTSPPERFAMLRQQLGDNFVGVEIDSSKGNADGIPPRAHSVLTENLVDEPGNPTRDALERVLDLFRRKLLEPSAS
jgi:dienelactone hydrolase